MKQIKALLLILRPGSSQIRVIGFHDLELALMTFEKYENKLGIEMELFHRKLDKNTALRKRRPRYQLIRRIPRDGTVTRNVRT